MRRRFSVAAVALLGQLQRMPNPDQSRHRRHRRHVWPLLPTPTVPERLEAIKMAIADFGGLVLGQPIELLTADHQNKPDIGVQKFREWADRDGVTMVMLEANTGVSLAMPSVAKEKKITFFAIDKPRAPP